MTFPTSANGLAIPVRIRVTLTLDVWPDHWCQDYGVEETLSAVRQDVRNWVANMVNEELRGNVLGVGARLA